MSGMKLRINSKLQHTHATHSDAEGECVLIPFDELRHFNAFFAMQPIGQQTPFCNGLLLLISTLADLADPPVNLARLTEGSWGHNTQ